MQDLRGWDGKAADVAVGDFWHADERGFPRFNDEDGRSVLIARTLRGQRIVETAVKAGVIAIGPVDLDQVARIQPHQRVRRRTLIGRLLGRRIVGGRSPKYVGFRLTRVAFADPLRTIKAFLGSFRRGAPSERMPDNERKLDLPK